MLATESQQLTGKGGGPISGPALPPVARQPLLTSQALALELSVTPEFCEQRAKEKAWPSHRIGRYLRFDLAEVRAAITANAYEGPK